MPPKHSSKPQGSTPTNRIYKAVEPLHQTTFPEKKKRITRNYGKKSGIKLEKQDTLTQMDWVQLYEREEQRKEIEDDIEDSEVDYEREEVKRETKRRRTVGDEPATKRKRESKNRRRMLGEDGKTPSFSTQTITQLDHWPLSGAPEELESVEDASVYDVPVTSPPAVHPPRRSPRRLPRPDISAPVGLMPPPQTPKCRKVFEIPSSQSPATPTSSQFGGSARKRSPLKEQSTNIAVPFSLRPQTYMSAEKLPRLKVEDTYETGTDESQAAQTPSKHSSPTKTVRFAVPDPSQESLAENAPIKQESATQRSVSPTRRLGNPAPTSIKLEILDSDAEEDEEVEESQIVTDTTLKINFGYEGENIIEGIEQDDSRSENNTRQIEIDAEKEPGLPETLYGDLGAETQFRAEKIMSLDLSDLQQGTPLSEDAPRNGSYSHRRISTQQTQTQHTYTQHKKTRNTHTQHTQTQHTQFGKSQYPESQRLSTQQLDAMAPRSEGSDIFISIYPARVENIISRNKNHEFRSYNFPATVSRIWIYQTKPLSTLTHMAVIGPSKTPGEITNLDGLGNAEFNAGETRSKFAYEILELYALANPMTFEELKSRQWFRAAPQKYARVPPAVLGELIANLLPPIFTQSSSSSSVSPPTTNFSQTVYSIPTLYRTSSDGSESQEVQEQITNNIAQFIQVQGAAKVSLSSPPAATPAPIVHVPSSQHNLVRPSQATTVDYTQTQTPVTPRHLPRESPIPDLIPESPVESRSVPSSRTASTVSSPVQMLPPVIMWSGERRVIEIESQSEDEDEDEDEANDMNHNTEIELQHTTQGDLNHTTENETIEEAHLQFSTPQPYSLIRSSQLMTRSQMMREQDSLIDGEIMRPPPTIGGKWEGVVGDSDEEEDGDS